MSKIYKYPIQIGVPTVENVPLKQILTFQDQYGCPTVWIEIDDGLPQQDITFMAVGTGWEFNLFGYTYLGTTQSNGYVWHCYYKLGKEGI